MAAGFRERLRAGEQLVGTFIKTPTTHATEIFGELGYDFIVIDEEHAPFDRGSIDVVLLAARASGIASIVRVRSTEPSGILSVLDCGATGVLVPHVSSAEMAQEVVASCKYKGHRGFAVSTRAGRYGAAAWGPYLQESDKNSVVIAMIEDREGLENIDAIASVDGIDALFIGRGDLTVALGASANDAPPVQAAVDLIVAACKKANKQIWVTSGSAAEASKFRSLGATAFIVASDHGLMRRAAAAALKEISGLAKNT
jgi:2-keto-3-deoxy-L-rhamnonate aldolase RhmA